jgi:predicted phage tail component-like protein
VSILFTLSFNGITKPYLKVLKIIDDPSWAPVEREFLEINGKPGAILTKTKTKPRPKGVEVLIESENITDYEILREDLAAWLVTDNPKELVISNEPDRTYFAVVDGLFDPEKIVRFGKGIINFICPDPYKYGPNQPALFETEIGTITNSGTKETYPIFRAAVKEPITFLDIVSDEAYMRIGEPVDIANEVPFEKEERLIWDQCSSLTGWANATEVDGGVIAGLMKSDGNRFIASSYGTGEVWHGPAIKTSIPNGPLTDFRVDAIVGLGNGQNHQMGRVEVYLLDESNNTVAKLALKDTYSGAALAYGEARIGDNTVNSFLINEAGDRRGNWNNFYGMLRIQRVGNEWEAYIAQIDPDTNQHHTRRLVTFVDAENVFNKSLAQIQVHVAEYGSNAAGTLAIYDVKVFRINPNADYQIPYIALPGDVIEIDHSKNRILINGEDRKDLKDFGASFFPLEPGINNVQISPYTSFETVEVEWRDRYL